MIFLDKLLHEECGVFGVFANKKSNVAATAYYGLFALQHRGQESCGIVVNDDGVFNSYKDVGLVNDVFTPEILGNLGLGNMAVGHVRYGTTGANARLNAQPILDVIEKGYIPVVSTVGCDSEGNVYNINADTAAARIAGALKAESLITLPDIAGILRDRNDPDSLIKVIRVSETARLIGEGVITGGMIPKVECCTHAIQEGVRRVFIIDGRIPHSILIETLTDEGIGTMFEGDPAS